MPSHKEITMNKKTTGLVAGAAGAALLVSGATFALWSDSEEVAGGTITAGNLDVALIGAPAWQDVSAGRAGHDIDLATFKIVPGDTIQGHFGIAAALEGDNLVAELGLAFDGPSGELLAAEHGVTVTYSLVDAENETVGTVSRVPAGEAATVHFASADNSDNTDPALVTLPATIGTTPLYTVVVEAKFDATTPERVRTHAAAVLSDLTVSLEQDRTADIGGGF
jgi:alternate signal-mediated exported protein